MKRAIRRQNQSNFGIFFCAFSIETKYNESILASLQIFLETCLIIIIKLIKTKNRDIAIFQPKIFSKRKLFQPAQNKKIFIHIEFPANEYSVILSHSRFPFGRIRIYIFFSLYVALCALNVKRSMGFSFCTCFIASRTHFRKDLKLKNNLFPSPNRLFCSMLTMCKAVQSRYGTQRKIGATEMKKSRKMKEILVYFLWFLVMEREKVE